MNLEYITLPLLFGTFIGVAALIYRCCKVSEKKNLVPLGKSGAFVAREFIEKLDEDIDKYNFLAENVPCIIWSGNPTGETCYYNHRWYEYTGLSWEESKNDGWEKVVHSSDVNQATFLWKKSIEEGIPYKAKIRLLRDFDQTYRWHLAQSVPRYNRQGEIVQWVGSCVDIDKSL